MAYPMDLFSRNDSKRLLWVLIFSLAVATIVTTLTILFEGRYNTLVRTFNYFLNSNAVVVFSTVFIWAGLIGIGFRVWSATNEIKSFSDIDDRERREKLTAWRRQSRSGLSSTEKGEDTAEPGNYERAEIKPKIAETFAEYFHGLSSALEDKATLYDEKASVLLDKGTLYARYGIGFFLLSIVAWQSLAYLTGFKTQYIYGIATCSVLFIFVEFLAAWFLKQYSQFVDTATYLTKIKSIFDKYMLAYLCVKELPKNKDKNMEPLIALLSEDIKWPDTYLLKNADVSFARETMETMSHLMKTMKDQVKETASSKSEAKAPGK